MTREYIVKIIDDGSKRSEENIRELECEWGAEEIEQQPCEDAISREDAIGVILRFYTKCERMGRLRFTPNLIKQECADMLSVMPSVTTQPKRGKWIFNKNMHDYCCSECGCLMPSVNEYYRKKIIGCPYCLADMREVKADDE